MKLATNLWLSIFAIGVAVTFTAVPASAQQIEGADHGDDRMG
jgi:hypothetical protein